MSESTNNRLMKNSFSWLIFSAVQPVSSYFLNLWSLQESVIGFLSNLFLLLLAAVILKNLLKTTYIAKHEDLSKIIPALIAYLVLFVFCLFNTFIFIDLLEIVLHNTTLKKIPIVLFAVRWLLAIGLFYLLTKILVDIFSQLSMIFKAN